jgi:cell division protein ZapA
MQVRITIRGRQYTVRGDESEEEVQAVARELDARLASVAARTRSFDEYTIALLTALNLASELHRLKGQVSSRLQEIDREAASVAAVLESLLPVDGEEDEGASRA